MGTVLRQSNPRDVYYAFADQVGIDQEVGSKTIIISGNRNFEEYGDEDLIKVLSNDYYDDDPKLFENDDGTCYEDAIGYDYDKFEELKKLTGKEWEERTIRGYSQGDWQTVYYAKGEVSDERLDEIENFYMGKVTEFVDEENVGYLVPDDVAWKGKKAICDYIGVDPSDATVYNEGGEEIQ